ncbi:MAG: hypothetical protein FH758_00150 [Firmicutes bacterium]|nr:hypothetical protein [Bacillota bacterium]
MPNYFNQDSVKELKARLQWILKLGTEKKVYLSTVDDGDEEVFKPVKAATVLETEHTDRKVIDLGFQYKGSGRTLTIRNVCAFNWSVLNYPDENTPKKVNLTLFCLDKNSPNTVIPKKYVLKFDECPQDQYISEEYVMIS